jgi:transaldolase
MWASRESLNVKLFADGADLEGMIEMASKPFISGLTTNPTLMKKAGITNYVKFAKEVLREITAKPISFEVFSDDIEEMKIQGEKIASWGENVYVKIPITNTKGESTLSVINYLAEHETKVNITARMTNNQVSHVMEALNPNIESCVSVFAGRIADTGRDPVPIMRDCVQTLAENKKCELIWASPRELLNIFQANDVGCQIVTATNDILKKLDLIGYDLEAYSLDTVKMFFQDAKNAGYSIQNET